MQEIDTSTEITGTGLGLKIVKDIVSSYRGKIEVVSPKEGFNTCLRIEIPIASEKELDDCFQPSKTDPLQPSKIAPPSRWLAIGFYPILKHANDDKKTRDYNWLLPTG